MVLPTHRYRRPVIPSARLGIRAPAFLSWRHFPINVDSSEKPSSKGGSPDQPIKKEKNTHFHAQLSFFVFVITVRLATCDMEARASPRNP
jgi:hypothetical protein